jgi:DNA-binding transcriptional ArsR family regulator
MGGSTSSKLTEILQTVVDVKQTGYLKIRDGEQEGCVAVENGVILHARAGAAMGLPALFQFVVWREAKIEFHERPMPAGIERDLAVYDPQLLLTGVAFKVDEQNLLHDAIPALDAVVKYVGGEGLASVEITPADRTLLVLVDGRRTVREIAERMGQSLTEVARHLGRFRMAGVVEVVSSRPGVPPKPVKPVMAAAG